MRALVLGSLLGSVALLAGGCDCGESEVTEILVEIDSDLVVPEELSSLQVRIDSTRGESPSSERLNVTYDVVPSVPGDPGGSVGGSNVRLPVRIGIVPGAADTTVRIEALGSPGTDAGPVRVSASLAFTPGRALLLHLRLPRVCGGVECAEAETCQDQDGTPLCVPEAIFNPPCVLADLGTGRIEGCDPDDGLDAGTGDPCATLVCPPGMDCQVGACVSTDPCLGIRCDEGLVCTGGECADGRLDEDGDGYPIASDCDDRDPDVVPGSVASCSTECGEGTSTCGNGEWLPCTAPDECGCDPGETRAEACGRCGTAERTCTSNGTWGAVSACADEGECVPSSTQTEPCEGGSACSQHSRVCTDACTWAEWSACEDPAECTPSVTESQACGNCGTRERTCSAQCLWGTFGACEGEGVCVPDTSQSQACGNCGSQSRSCSAQCQWGAWGSCGEGVCSPGASESRGCGNCGSQNRSCGGDCNWGAWSACNGEGACTPGATQTQACGDCGTETRTCSAGCGWGAWGACSGQGPCAPGATQACGNCGSRTCTGSCTWGACGGEGVCAAGSTRGCGNCNEGSETCSASCTWSGSCANEPCTPLTTERDYDACCGGGSYRERACSLTCRWDPWMGCCDFDGACELPCEHYPEANCSDCACDHDGVCENSTNGENCGPCLDDCDCPNLCGAGCSDPECCQVCNGVCAGTGCGAIPCN